MKTSVKRLENNTVEVTVTIDAEEIDQRISDTYKQFAKDYNIPGFRKGKAPRAVLDSALGPGAVLAKVTDDVIEKYYPLSIDQGDIYPILKPDFKEEGIVEAGKDFKFIYTVGVKPEYELSRYDPAQVVMLPNMIGDDEVEKQLDALRAHFAEYEDAAADSKVKKEDSVRLSVKTVNNLGEEVEGLTDEAFQYTLGSELMPEEFDKQLIGMVAGDTKKFSMNITSDPGVYLTDQVGKASTVDIEATLSSVLIKNLPELTDEWVKAEVGFENVAELRERIEESVEEQQADMQRRLKENQCMSIIVGRLEGEVPEELVEGTEARMLQDFFVRLETEGMTFDEYLAKEKVTKEDFDKEIRTNASDVAEQELALDAWARHYGIAVTDEEIHQEFMESGLEDPEAEYNNWAETGRLHLIREGLTRTRSLEHLLETADVKDTTSVNVDATKVMSGEEETIEAPAEEASEEEASADGE